MERAWFYTSSTSLGSTGAVSVSVLRSAPWCMNPRNCTQGQRPCIRHRSKGSKLSRMSLLSLKHRETATHKSMINTGLRQGNSGDSGSRQKLCKMSFSECTLFSARPRPALSHDGIAAVHLLRRICIAMQLWWWFSGYRERGHRT